MRCALSFTRLIANISALLICLCTIQTSAGVLLNESQLRRLAKRLAPKVNLFHEVWELDPNAEFYAGTTRDYLYWIYRKFREAKSDDLSEIEAELMRRDFIDIREVVGGESDIDVMSKEGGKLSQMDALSFGVRKLDRVSFDRIDPKTELGLTEIKQGSIALEKMRLSKSKGLLPPDHFGNGAKEIATGTISIDLPNPTEFWKTHYAKAFQNHPVLLVVRYIRILAQDYYNRYGQVYPEPELLLGQIPKALQSELRQIVISAITDPKFERFLGIEQGRRWLNASILKSYRSHTNPTATHLLMQTFGVGELIAAHSDKIASINQFLFLERRDQSEIRKNFKAFRVKPESVIRFASERFPNLKVLHGAGSYEAFRAMILQGALPSDPQHSTAGAGLYVVKEDNVDFAKTWARRRSNRDDLVVELELKPESTVMDIREGKGLSLFKAWLASMPNIPKGSDQFTEFSRAFGVDILEYSYDTQAFVIKNSAVLAKAQGHTLKLKTLQELVDGARSLTLEKFSGFLAELILATQTPAEIARILSVLPNGLLEESIRTEEWKKAMNRLSDPRDRRKAIRSLWRASSKGGELKGLAKELETIFLDIEAKEICQNTGDLRPDYEALVILSEILPEAAQIHMAKTDPRPEVRRWLVRGFVNLPPTGARTKILSNGLDDKDGSVRMEAVSMITTLHRERQPLAEVMATHPRAMSVLIHELGDSSSSGLQAALEVIRNQDSVDVLSIPEIAKNISQVISQPSKLSNEAKIQLLLWMNENLLVRRQGGDESDRRRGEAYSSIFSNPDRFYTHLLDDPDVRVRMLAAVALTRFTASDQRSDFDMKTNEKQKALSLCFEALEYSNKKPMLEIDRLASEALHDLIAQHPSADLKREIGERSLLALQNPGRISSLYIRLAGESLQADPRLFKVLENIVENDQTALPSRVSALAALAARFPQSSSSPIYLKRLIDILSRERSGYESMDHLEHLAVLELSRLSGRLSKAQIETFLHSFDESIGIRHQVWFVEFAAMIQPDAFHLASRLRSKMNSELFYENHIAKLIIQTRSPFSKTAFFKILKYLEFHSNSELTSYTEIWSQPNSVFSFKFAMEGLRMALNLPSSERPYYLQTKSVRARLEALELAIIRQRKGPRLPISQSIEHFLSTAKTMTCWQYLKAVGKDLIKRPFYGAFSPIK